MSIKAAKEDLRGLRANGPASEPLTEFVSLRSREASGSRNPRVALLTPYTGGNLGDAAIQDALIANLRLRLPAVQFAGISLNNDNFVERHGQGAFPLCWSDAPFYAMDSATPANQFREGAISVHPPGQRRFNATLIKRLLRRSPGLVRLLKDSYLLAKHVWGELRHVAAGYRFLRGQDLLIVSGGGQLDEEWGGSWGHPFALFKWAILARMSRVPFAFASVGACKVTSATTKFFLGAALRMARYRSYRDNNSRGIAGSLLRRAARDSVVPDLAFSLRSSDFPAPAGIRSISQGRTVVAISPIAFARTGSWPWTNPALHERYVQQMTQVLSELLKRGYFLVIVVSSLGDDERVIPELLERTDNEAKTRYAQQLHAPRITAWQHLTASLLEADLLIASRLHSVTLGFLTETPTVAISFDPKVDWLMQDVGQTDYLLQIKDFTSDEVIAALSRIETRRAAIVRQITSYRQQCTPAFELQYDVLAGLAVANSNHSN